MILHEDPHDLPLRPVHALCGPLPVALGMDWETSDQGRTGGLAFPRGRIKNGVFRFGFLSFLRSLTLGETSCCVVSAFRPPVKKYLEWKRSLWTTASEELRPADDHTGELRTGLSGSSQALLCGRCCQQPDCSRRLWAWTPWPLKQLPASCPWEAVRENKCLLFQAAKFGGNLLHSNR